MRLNLTRETLANHLLEWIWPSTCPLCASPASAHNALCQMCWQELPILLDPKCEFCGAEVQGEGAPICTECYAYPRSWDFGSSLMHYQGSARQMVIMLKSMKSEPIAEVMANLMYRQESEIFANADCLVPVPLHWTKQITRGFNQSALIAFYLSKLSGLEFCDLALKRSRATKKQTSLSGFDERFENLASAFVVANPKRVEGRQVLVIDDVMTSGASFENAALALREAGVERIGVYSFARAGLGHDLSRF